jgi:hypothetical protein
MRDEEVKVKVTVAPQAFALMALHAACYSTSEVHGVLIGSRSDTKVEILDAYPICHETPTKPLVETALALVQSSLSGGSSENVIGWFTAPEVLSDRKPGPVALRITAELSTNSIKPILLVLNNEIIGQLINGEKSSASTAIQAYGQDIGKQWMDLLEVTVLQETKATTATRELYKEGLSVLDLVDHWQTDTSSNWNGSAPLVEQMEKFF